MTISKRIDKNLNEYGISHSIYENTNCIYYYVREALFLNPQFKSGVHDLFLINGNIYLYSVALNDDPDMRFICCSLQE